MGTYARTGTLYEVGLYSLGEALVKEGFREAAGAFFHTVTSAEQAWHIQQSLAFINGSGLEIAIETFGLSLSPERLRDTFSRWSKHSPSSASSSHITQAGASFSAALKA